MTVRSTKRRRFHANLEVGTKLLPGAASALDTARLKIDFRPHSATVGTVKTLSFPVVLLAAISLSSLAQFPGEPYTKGVPKEGAMGIRETSQKDRKSTRLNSSHIP